jgi:hypothetical protein
MVRMPSGVSMPLAVIFTATAVVSALVASA